MSKRIRERLAQLNIQDTTHEERLALDLEIERLTGVWCDIGNDQLTDQQFRDALARIREQLKRKKKQEQQEAGEDGSVTQQQVVTAGVA